MRADAPGRFGHPPANLCPRLRARLAAAGAVAQPAHAGRHFRARHPAGERGGTNLMRAYWTLVRRELGGHFVSWTGYVVMAVVLFLLGLCFLNLLQALNGQPSDRPVTELFFSTVYFWLILQLASPVITMRSFAQEKSSGTFETLMTAPVSDHQVVLAKFSGALLFYCLSWLPLLGCLFIVHHFSRDQLVLDP